VANELIMGLSLEASGAVLAEVIDDGGRALTRSLSVPAAVLVSKERRQLGARASTT